MLLKDILTVYMAAAKTEHGQVVSSSHPKEEAVSVVSCEFKFPHSSLDAENPQTKNVSIYIFNEASVVFTTSLVKY